MYGGSSRVSAVLSFATACVVAACSGPSESAVGTLVVNLSTATPDGKIYRLRDATITITGPDSVQVFHTEDSPDRASLSANVPAGHYAALLDPGWRLERLEQFSDATVNAELVSDNPLDFTVDFGMRTVVPLRFRTNIGEVDLSQGYDLTLDVEEVAVRGVVVSSFFGPDEAPQLAVFPPNASGASAPLRTIDGTEFSLVEATGVAVAGDEIIVADQFYPMISVFPLGADGRRTQSRQIAGLNNDMALPTAIAVYQGEMYVADIGKVLVFPLAADGDVAPSREITGLRVGEQIAIDREAGELYVPGAFSGAVRVYPAGASGEAAPVRTIAGTHTGLISPCGVALFDGGLFVSDCQTGDLRVFSTLADGDATPLRVLNTAHNGIGSLGQLSVARDEIYVVNKVTKTVDVFPINATGATPPTRSFAGSTPVLPFEPFGVAVF